MDLPVIGVSIEAQFHGMLHRHANVFSNIDTFLRSHGFTLYNLETRRYSRSALPRKFAITLPAETEGGQIIWGEALYFRDLSAENYDRMWSFKTTLQKTLKLICLFDIFDLHDCAAELLLRRRDLFPDNVVTSMLNILTPRLYGRKVDYQTYIQEFEQQMKAGNFCDFPTREPAPEKIC